jgi:multidrug efflux pump subunit AcrA (membrane-fusion protein)
MKKTTGIGIAAIVAALAVGALLWRGSKPRATAPATATVEAFVELARSDVVDAETTVLDQGVTLTGSLRAVSSAVVKARVAG